MTDPLSSAQGNSLQYFSRYRAPFARSQWRLWCAGVVVGLYPALVLSVGTPVVLAPAVLVGGALFVVLILLAPVAALTALLIILGAAGLTLSTLGVDLGVRIYLLDPIIAALLVATAAGAIAAPERWQPRWPFQGLFALLLLFLTLSAFYGIARGNDLRQVLGDYRRMAVYPLALFAFCSIIQSRRDSSVVLRALVVASLVTTAIEAFRIVTGTGYAEEELAGSTVRYLSYLEATTAGIGALIFIGYARIARGSARLMALLGALLLIATVLFANYRTAWIALVGGLAVQAFALGIRRGLTLAVIGTAVFAPFVYGLVAFTSLGEFVLDRFDPMNAGASGIWRLFSWRAATEAWLREPLFGTGLGYDHEFQYISVNSGTFVAATENTIHNDPLWYLVNNGIVGVVVAFIFLIPWARRALQLASDSQPWNRMIGSTALGALALMILVSMLQPVFSVGAAVVLACVFLALVLRTQPYTAGSA